MKLSLSFSSLFPSRSVFSSLVFRENETRFTVNAPLVASWNLKVVIGWTVLICEFHLRLYFAPGLRLSLSVNLTLLFLFSNFDCWNNDRIVHGYNSTDVYMKYSISKAFINDIFQPIIVLLIKTQIKLLFYNNNIMFAAASSSILDEWLWILILLLAGQLSP